jgi:hypothetical protein
MNLAMPNSRFVTCRCGHCDNGIEFDSNELVEENSVIACPHCGREIKLRVIPSRATRIRVAVKVPSLDIRLPSPVSDNVLPKDVPPEAPAGKRKRKSRLASLTAETIKKRTKSGDTPLHLAAKSGNFHEIPDGLLKIDLFMVKNNAGETPLHIAAKCGHLGRVPRQFLTKETVSITTSPPHAPSGFYTTGTGYIARTETVLHIAVGNGYNEQIPAEFVTPEFLSIPARGYRETLLHLLANINRLDLVPEIYATSEMWNLREINGLTPREVVEQKAVWEARRKIRIAESRKQSATEKQKEKLAWFGCTWDASL